MNAELWIELLIVVLRIVSAGLCCWRMVPVSVRFARTNDSDKGTFLGLVDRPV